MPPTLDFLLSVGGNDEIYHKKFTQALTKFDWPVSNMLQSKNQSI